MKAIFLDIDGVLNCEHTENPRHLPYVVDALLLARLQSVLDATGAAIVLSSTWRYDPAGLFSARRYGIPFIDVTPDLPRKPRRDEVTEWLGKHPEVTRFAILDDEDDELDELPLFQPSRRTGLTTPLANHLIAYLNGNTDRDSRSNIGKRLLQNISAALRGHQG
jgi:hypothetical protein